MAVMVAPFFSVEVGISARTSFSISFFSSGVHVQVLISGGLSMEEPCLPLIGGGGLDL